MVNHAEIYTPAPLELTSNRLAGKVTFITGASSGIGAAAAVRFAAEGAKVVLAARRVDRLQALAAELRDDGHDALAVECDVTDERSVESAIATTLDVYGRLDCAFNNAGLPGQHRLLHESEVEWFDAVHATNLRGPFLCMKHEIRAMLAGGTGGSIVNTSSIGGLVGAANNNDYASSKWGLAGLVRCAALGYAKERIRVNAIAPGSTHSEMFDRWINTEETRQMAADWSPMHHIADPDDMARAALLLLSDETRFTTGVVLPCDGGMFA